MSRRVHRNAALALALLAASACKKADRRVCTDLGRAGGVLQSYDTVLTIAIQPEALDETDRYCIEPTDDTPAVFGEAYRVDPSVRLNYDAIVSYRGQLPDDLEDTNVARVSKRDFEAGRGMWQSLSDCRVDAEVRHVECPDRELSMFYGLLDRFAGNDTLASDTLETSGGSQGTSGTSAETTTVDPETGTDTGPQPIDYPPACDEPADGPFELVELGSLFEEGPDGGAEDFAPDGQGGFIGRRVGTLARLDVTGATFGTADGFTVSDLTDSPSFAQATLGLRYAPSGELVLAQTDGALRAMASDGELRTITDGIGLPNGVFVGLDSVVWYTDFVGNRVHRIPLRGGAPTELAMLNGPNGIYYDRLREVLFYVSFNDAILWRIAVTADGRPGEPVMVADVGGALDGLAMDECGNLYIVDNNTGSDARLVRVAMDDEGELVSLEDLVTGIDGGVANAVFGLGDAYGDFQTSLFLTGVPGEISYVDVGRRGAEVPVLDAPPATEGGGTDTGGTDTGGSSSGGGGTSTTGATSSSTGA